MNIFAISLDPVEAAHGQCDRHVVKMVLESVQILCTVFAMVTSATDVKQLADETGVALYKATHRGHPCVVWAAERKNNFAWLGLHALALADEYTRRYKKVHKSERLIRPIVRHALRPNVARFAKANNFQRVGGVPVVVDFPLAMPDAIRGSATRAPPGAAVELYRRYYETKAALPWAKYDKVPKRRPLWLETK